MPKDVSVVHASPSAKLRIGSTNTLTIVQVESGLRHSYHRKYNSKEEQGFHTAEVCEGHCVVDSSVTTKLVTRKDRCGDTVQVNTERCRAYAAWTKHGRLKWKRCLTRTWGAPKGSVYRRRLRAARAIEVHSVPNAELYADWDKVKFDEDKGMVGIDVTSKDAYIPVQSSRVTRGDRRGDTVQVNTGRCRADAAWTKHGRWKCKRHASVFNRSSKEFQHTCIRNYGVKPQGDRLQVFVGVVCHRDNDLLRCVRV
ncbi:hypothetical protein MTR67_017960 [Solanum verrucosum]|uniref:Uncharacterized protein n=1 Tax=Solanum verrucosum TaxID=315347 RepID=A0AAF0QLH5_SOLVR|nr:hypothetical protein MTR67_017960 [Solanum verrucosum]